MNKHNHYLKLKLYLYMPLLKYCILVILLTRVVIPPPFSMVVRISYTEAVKNLVTFCNLLICQHNLNFHTTVSVWIHTYTNTLIIVQCTIKIICPQDIRQKISKSTIRTLFSWNVELSYANIINGQNMWGDGAEMKFLCENPACIFSHPTCDQCFTPMQKLKCCLLCENMSKRQASDFRASVKRSVSSAELMVHLVQLGHFSCKWTMIS